MVTDNELKDAIRAGIAYVRVPMFSAPIDPIVAELRAIGASHALYAMRDAWRTYDNAHSQLRMRSWELKRAIEHAKFVLNSKRWRSTADRQFAADLLDQTIRAHKRALTNYVSAREILTQTRADWRVYLGIAGNLWRAHATIDPLMAESLDAHRRAQRRQDEHAKRIRRARVSRSRVTRDA